MRILVFNDFARVTGGADVHCLQLAAGLRARGHEVAFISTADPRNIEGSGRFIPAIVTRDTRSATTGLKAAKVALYALWNPNAASAAASLLSSFRPDVIHAHKLYPQLSVAPLVVASRHKIPIVQTLHDYEFISASEFDHTGSRVDRAGAQRGYRALNTALFAVKRNWHIPRVAQWISVSRFASDLHSRHGIASTVLPNFTGRCRSRSQAFGERGGVLFSGRLSEEKGVHHVLALAAAAPWLRVVIAGDGVLAEVVRAAARDLDNLTYRGWISQDALAKELSSARLVIVPSLWHEPAGLAALEAMAAGTPLIAYDRGGLAEYVTDADAGITIPPSPDLLLEAVSSLYTDATTWEAASRSAQSAAARNHSLSSYLDRLENVYRRALLAKPSAAAAAPVTRS